MPLGNNESYKRCPSCHSIYAVYNSFTGKTRNLTEEEIDELIAQGIYIWGDDPILTPHGLAGGKFKGKTHIKPQQIQEEIKLPKRIP